uniref:Uncharacterized protein n=1 Tax=Streptomyces phage Geonosis TaxID=3158856 RepID=A0AAU7GYP5_9CAUD
MKDIVCLIVMAISALALFGIIDTPLIVDAGLFAVAVALLWNSARDRSDRS